MKFKGTITEVSREESFYKGKKAVLAKAKASLKSVPGNKAWLADSNIVVCGYEPAAKFALGQQVIFVMEDV